MEVSDDGELEAVALRGEILDGDIVLDYDWIIARNPGPSEPPDIQDNDEKKAFLGARLIVSNSSPLLVVVATSTAAVVVSDDDNFTILGEKKVRVKLFIVLVTEC